jgi:hypothetical protein
MNMKGKNWVAAMGLVLLFGACEKDIPAGGGKGEKVEILFSINTKSYNTEDNVVRGADMGEAVRTTVPLEDGFYLEAALMPDEEEELRGPVGFTDGQKLCFAAYDLGGAQVGATAVYTYSGGKWVSGSPLGVVPDAVTEYRFVAWSYFGETGTPPADGIGIDPVHDLVWGMSVDTKIEGYSEAERTVDINMLHQFARVMVKVRSTSISGADITALSGVQVEGGQLATLTPFDGGISWSGTATQGIDDPFTVVSGTVRESGYRTVTPVASPVKVRIGSVQVTGSPVFSNVPVLFNATLDGVTSYTLVVDLVRGYPFAYSNIYYDGTNLTFDRSGATASIANSCYYQGVFFKWGSLIGVSPIGGGDATILYIPNTGNKTWDASKTISTSSFGNWAGIPYTTANSSLSSPADKGENFLYNHSDFGQYKGDICRYIDGDWRMPNGNEWASQVGGTVGNGGSGTSKNAAGTGIMTAWNQYRKIISGGTHIPDSGWVEDGVAKSNTGTGYDLGNHWSGSATGSNAYMYNFNGLQNQAGIGGNLREIAGPVRCIRAN